MLTGCVDGNKKCKRWATPKRCKRNRFVAKLCNKSCGLCGITMTETTKTEKTTKRTMKPTTTLSTETTTKPGMVLKHPSEYKIHHNTMDI